MPENRATDAFTRLAVSCVDLVRRGALAVAAAALVLTVAGGYYAVTDLTINTDTSGMISQNLPYRQRYAEFKKAFPQFTDTFVVVVDGDTPERAEMAAIALARRISRDTRFRTVYAPEIDPFFARNGLLYLDLDALGDLTDRLADAQPLLTTLADDASLRGLFGVLELALDDIAKGGTVPAGLGDVIDRIGQVAASVRAGDPRPFSWSEVLLGAKATGDARRQFIVVQPVMDFTRLQPAAAAMAAVRDLARDLGPLAADGVRVRLTGGAAIETEELRSVTKDAGIAGLLSLVIVGVLLVIGLKSVRLVVAVLLTLIAGLVWTAAFTALAIGHLNLISVAFAVLFIGLGVDFGIHYALRYLEEARRSGDNAEALRRATEGVGGPLGLCAVAAALGFYSFAPTDYSGLSELGLIAGSGMFIALFATMTVLPALIALLMPESPVTAPPPVRLSVAAYASRHGGRISAAAIGIGLAAAAAVPLARFDADPTALKDPSTESVRVFNELVAEGRNSPYAIEIVARDLAAARGVAARLDAERAVDRAVTLASFVPDDQDEKLALIRDAALFLTPLFGERGPAPDVGDAGRSAATAALRARIDAFVASGAAPALAARAGRLARSLAPLADDARALAVLERQLLLFLPSRIERLRQAMAAERISLEELPAKLKRRYLSADGRARVQVFPADDLRDPDALRGFVRAVYRVAPDATSAPVEIVESADAVVGAVRQAALTALIAITLLLFVLLRSVRNTFLVLLPLALAAAVTVATSVVLNMPFNFANVIVLPLLVGLGVASGIHLVVRAGQTGRDAALSQTSTPRAVIFSALTTVGSFGTLTLSSHRGLSSMGVLLTLAIGLTLVGALVVLPALMTWLAPKSAEGEP